MPLPNIVQPETIDINECLRLRKYDGNYKPAFDWYKDPVVVYNSEGIADPEDLPDESYIIRMYNYLNSGGELYFIEVLEDGAFVPVGDVTLRDKNPPIAIGAAKYRGRGYGRKVMAKIIERAKELGFKSISRVQVYDYNTASQKMFESLGFVVTAREGGCLYYELRF